MIYGSCGQPRAGDSPSRLCRPYILTLVPLGGTRLLVPSVFLCFSSPDHNHNKGYVQQQLMRNSFTNWNQKEIM